MKYSIIGMRLIFDLSGAVFLVILQKIFPNCSHISVRFINTFAVLLFLFAAADLFAQQQNRTVFRFLELHPDARQAALGAAHPALVGPGFSLMTTNPAFLNEPQKFNLQAAYQNHLGDVNYGAASYFYDLGDPGSMAVSIRYLNYGTLTEYDEQGNDLGSLTANDLALSAGYAAGVTENLSYGVSATLIHSSLAGFRSSGVAFSGGLYYNFPGRETAIGASIVNAGRQLSTFNGVREPLPLNISAGIVHRLQYLPVRLHYSLQRLNTPGPASGNDTEDPSTLQKFFRHSAFGTEFLFGQYVTVRLGYDHYLNEQLKTGKRVDGAGLGMGLGLSLNTVDIHFARTSYSDMGNIIQLSMAVSI